MRSYVHGHGDALKSRAGDFAHRVDHVGRTGQISNRHLGPEVPKPIRANIVAAHHRPDPLTAATQQGHHRVADPAGSQNSARDQIHALNLATTHRQHVKSGHVIDWVPLGLPNRPVMRITRDELIGVGKHEVADVEQHRPPSGRTSETVAADLHVRSPTPSFDSRMSSCVPLHTAPGGLSVALVCRSSVTAWATHCS